MASSRWKRFAFFEKNTLNLPSEVLEDLIPIGETKNTTDRTSGRHSLNALSELSSAAPSDNISLTVTTAALPLDSKPKIDKTINDTNEANINDYALALDGLWTSVTACNPVENFPTSSGYSATVTADNNTTTSTNQSINLPSQAQTFEDDSNVLSPGTAVDGLVLAFVTSCETDRIHCFDISVRCNKKPHGALRDSTATAASINTAGKRDDELEDLDGWRGYLAPVEQYKRDVTDLNATNTRSGEQRITTDHMGDSAGKSERLKEGIVGIATCRASFGHRPVHMACITHTNLVICIDPHLYLSWYVVNKIFAAFVSAMLLRPNPITADAHRPIHVSFSVR